MQEQIKSKVQILINPKTIVNFVEGQLSNENI